MAERFGKAAFDAWWYRQAAALHAQLVNATEALANHARIYEGITGLEAPDMNEVLGYKEKAA